MVRAIILDGLLDVDHLSSVGSFVIVDVHGRPDCHVHLGVFDCLQHECCGVAVGRV